MRGISSSAPLFHNDRQWVSGNARFPAKCVCSIGLSVLSVSCCSVKAKGFLDDSLKMSSAMDDMRARRRSSNASQSSSCQCGGRVSKNCNHRHCARHRQDKRDPKIRHLCDLLQSVRRSSPLDVHPGSSRHAEVSSAAGEFPECLSPPSSDTDGEAALNLQALEDEMGLQPTRVTRRPFQTSFARTPAQRTARPELEGNLGKTNNSSLTVDDKGQIRYFGYSSYMRMVSIFTQSKASSTKGVPSSSNNTATDTVEGEAMADSIQIQTHLIDLFFKYQNAAIPILDEGIFRLGYATGERSDYFSPFLLYAVLLRSLNFDDELRHRKTLATVYIDRAKAALLFELENPNIATIPGLCLFGYYLAGLGSDRACWLYPGW